MDEQTTETLVDDHESARLDVLKTGLPAADFLSRLCLAFTQGSTHHVPRRRPPQRLGERTND